MTLTELQQAHRSPPEKRMGPDGNRLQGSGKLLQLKYKPARDAFGLY